MTTASALPRASSAHSKLARAERRLPDPRERLAGCLWLPRVIAKARLVRAGGLPADYSERFCHPTSIDGQFLSFFGISREALLGVADATDAGVATWFTGLPAATPQRIAEWNRLAGNLGEPGLPLREPLPRAKAVAYRDVETEEIETVFELLQNRAGG